MVEEIEHSFWRHSLRYLKVSTSLNINEPYSFPKNIVVVSFSQTLIKSQLNFWLSFMKFDN